MAKPNIELIKRLRTRFLRMKHRAHFRMEIVAERNECGTALCIAGHALDLQGYRARFDRYGELDYFVTPRGRKVKNPLRVAARELGIPYGTWRSGRADADDLFNDISAIRTPKQAAARIQELIDAAESK